MRRFRIFDTFLFDGELDLLEHRLRETFFLVDQFVLVEASETYRGKPKPLSFAANRSRFEWAATKILPIALQSLGCPSATAWQRQEYQRNAIMLGLRGGRMEDIVLILDADEIASPSLLRRLRAEGLDRPHRLAMTRHYEYIDQLGPSSACCPPADSAFAFEMNRLRAGEWEKLSASWFGRSGIAVRFRDLVGDPERVLPARSAYDFRRGAISLPVLKDAGRHFLGVDPGARLENKLGRVSHAELGDIRASNPYFLRLARHCGIHHHGWWYAERPHGPLPGDLQRLAILAPTTTRQDPMPGMLQRSLLRNWAWLRYWPALPERLVVTIDQRFAILQPLLAPFLFLAAIVRALGSRRRWAWLRGLSTDTRNRGHT